MLTDPDGGVILIGGSTDQSINEKSLWFLSDAQSSWQQMPHTLSLGRYNHVAFFVPDEILHVPGQLVKQEKAEDEGKSQTIIGVQLSSNSESNAIVFSNLLFLFPLLAKLSS